VVRLARSDTSDEAQSNWAHLPISGETVATIVLHFSRKVTSAACAGAKTVQTSHTRVVGSFVLHLLCEGNSIRAVTRVTGTSKKAVSKLMVAARRAAAWYQDRVFCNHTCKRIQVDEIWAFVYAKQKNIAAAKKAPANAGDVWTWTAIDARIQS
jgi:hypothetical protein